MAQSSFTAFRPRLCNLAGGFPVEKRCRNLWKLSSDNELRHSARKNHPGSLTQKVAFGDTLENQSVLPINLEGITSFEYCLLSGHVGRSQFFQRRKKFSDFSHSLTVTPRQGCSSTLQPTSPRWRSGDDARRALRSQPRPFSSSCAS